MSGPLVAFTQPSGGMGEAGGGGMGDVAGPASAEDRQIAVYDGVTGKLLGTGTATLSPPGVIAGVTQLNVDNLRLDGNTISSTNTNGNVNLDPDGTGNTNLVSGALSCAGDAFLVRRGGGQLRTADVTQAAGSGAHFTGRYYAEAGASFGAYVQGDGQPRVAVGSGGLIAVSSTTDGSATPDLAMARESPGVWRDTDGSTGLGFRQTGRVVEASTAGVGSPNLLAATESRKLLTNEGATAEAYHTLPTAATGIEYLFYCQDTDGIRVVANAGDTIRIGANVSTAAGFVRSSTVGSVLQLVAINATEWVAVASSGTWTIDA